MFSKNILLLFCVVCFVEECFLKKSTDEKGLVEQSSSTIQWEGIFNKYDGNTDGYITGEELQGLLFHEFNGFVTVHQADRYITLMKVSDVKPKETTERAEIIQTAETTETVEIKPTPEGNQMTLSQLERMEPLIQILSKRIIEVEDKGIIPVEDFRKDIRSTFKLFENEIDISQLFTLIKGNGADEGVKAKEITEMLWDSERLDDIYTLFFILDEDKNNVLYVDEIAKLVQMVRPDLDSIKLAKKAMKAFDNNHSRELDFAEFVKLYCKPGCLDAKETFERYFKTDKVSRLQINDLLGRITDGNVLSHKAQMTLDKKFKNQITFQDIKNYAFPEFPVKESQNSAQE